MADVALFEALIQKLNDQYVFPDMARAMEQAIRTRLRNGEYEGMDTHVLCDALTAHLQELSRDKHLCVRPIRSEVPRLDTPGREESRQYAALQNFGFVRVERLPGNVGYLDLRAFQPPELGGDAAVAAMNFLAHTSALIIDLRQNVGGYPGMVALVTSYLFDQMVHLNSLCWRRGDQTHQYWTLPHVAGRRFGGKKPVYVLTSSMTFSAAEEFTYNLKHLKRATIVGEVTAGGANPGGIHVLSDEVEAYIPSGQAMNPITGTNWEGTGVAPDIPVPQDTAFPFAYGEALRSVLERLGEAPAGAAKALADEVRRVLAELATSET